MNRIELAGIGPGFREPVRDAQQVFRVGMDALAHPGRIHTLTMDTLAPAGVGAAANALLLALLDQDTLLHVSPALGEAAAQHPRFHTGCRLGALAEADFILLAASDAWPDFNTLRQGSEYSPEHSATVIHEVTSFAAGLPLALTGAGIAATQVLRAPELDQDFVAAWQAMRQRFPRGVDVFLTCGADVVGLPRSTRMEAACM
ncbi:MAG: phosphonate C-P lyase system protein PhnH [Betaproteobacteria bacterium]|nr:phosphonate C-P lyase system protein PhnH [Betaproteobacteria bacterium]